MKLEFARLHHRDKDELLRLVPKIDPDPRRVGAHALLLDELLDESLNDRSRFSCYSRTVIKGGRLVGHISARLVSDERAKLVRESASVNAYEDVKLLSRMSDEKLAFLNKRSEDGSCLVLNSFFWDRSEISKMQEVQFATSALERTVRFFEGNNITKVMAVLVKEFAILTKAFEFSQRGEFELFDVGSNHYGVVLKGPWTNGAVGWGGIERLLAERPHYDGVDRIDQKRRFEARILHECGFNPDIAWCGDLLPEWGTKAAYDPQTGLHTHPKDRFVRAAEVGFEGSLQKRYTPLSRFRNSIGKVISSTISDGQYKFEKIGEHFAENTWMMTPSIKR